MVDGGVGQVRAARNALRAVGDFPFPVMGVAKGPLRKVGEETLITESGEVMRWPASDPALHLIQEVRDEAHRFAVVGHRKRRDKKRGTSLLDCVDGIGRKKRRQLIVYFGGLNGVIAAGEEELAKLRVSEGDSPNVFIGCYIETLAKLADLDANYRRPRAGDGFPVAGFCRCR